MSLPGTRDAFRHVQSWRVGHVAVRWRRDVYTH